MTLQHVKVSEHISLSCIQTDRFKTGVLTLSLTRPDTPERSAYQMVLRGVLRRGTEKYPTMASIQRRLDELYASSVEIHNHRIGKNLTLSFTAEILDESFVPDDTSVIDGIMELLSQMLLHPKKQNGAFDETVVRQVLRYAKDGIDAEINNTRSYAATRLAELQHRADPTFSTLEQFKENLSLCTPKSLCEYHEELISSSPLQVFYVGSLAPERIAELLRHYFSAWTVTNREEIIPPCAEPATEYCAKTEEMPVSQGKLAMGFRTGVCVTPESNDCYVAMVLNELFGGAPASKLFMNVREKMNLCYYCSSGYNRYTGNMTVSSGIQVKNRKITEEAILAQLDAIRAGEISDAELHAAKTSLRNAYRQLYDNPFSLQGFYETRTLFGLVDDIEAATEKMERVTKEQIVSLAQRVTCDTVFFVEGTKDAQDEEEDDHE